MNIRNLITFKITIAIWIGCIFFLAFPDTAAAAGSLSLAVSSSTVAAGDTMTVTVYVMNQNGEEATSDMTITYDSSKMEYVSASGASATGGEGTVKASGSTVELKFKALASGDAYVKAEGTGVTAAGTHVTVSGNASSTTAADETTDSASDNQTTAPASSDTAKTGDADQTDTDTNETSSTDLGDVPTGLTAGGDAESIELDGVVYHIVDDIPENMIPPGFSLSHFEYKGVRHQGLTYEHGHMGLYYMANEAGEGKLFVYDADRDQFYPYVRLESGDHFIILMVVPNGAIPPEDYTATTLTIGEVSVPAYQYHGKDVEVVNVENTEMPEGSTGSDFYLVYAMDGEGIAGWYQYDKVQKTYQRLNIETAGEENDTACYDTLLASYNDLDTRFKETKTRNRRMIAVLIFLSVILLIIIINLVLRNREEYEDFEEDYVPEKRKKRTESPKRQAKTMEKPVAKPEKTVREKAEAREEEDSDFYDGDSEAFMAEFEDEPSVTSRHSHFRERQKPARAARESARKAEHGRGESQKTESKKTQEPLNDDDDDIEFLDLNDL